MIEVRCSGTPFEIGYQHGSAARDKVEGSLAFYRDLFQSSCRLDWASVLQEAAKYVEFLRRDCPRYYEEIEGIAKGADVDILDIVALNVRTEINFGLFTTDQSLPVQSDGCTSVAYKNKTGDVLLAQNWDWQKEQAVNLFVCHISQPDTNLPDISMVTEGGVIGKIGFNSSGVGVCLNAIRARGVNVSRYPIHVALRKALESGSARAAADAIELIGTAGSGHILVSDQSEALGLECTSVGIKELQLNNEGTLVHTNHLLLDHAGVEEVPWLVDSPRRLDRFNQLITNAVASTAFDKDSLFELFKDESGYPSSINRSQTESCKSETLFNIIMDLAARKGTVSVGRPTEQSQRIEIALRSNEQ
ncbi:unnamed protein product [Clonostachys solani]|uniref:Peptidase C45 hydrolase domain-containing protein n=1 Tax=Clonostachys solani TaxID=160281 RepID=A0A9P0E9W5_9HYPO|nr:unnamed protein product [Clonostachys solani]